MFYTVQKSVLKYTLFKCNNPLLFTNKYQKIKR